MTISAKRLRANRRNARRSTGPRTAAGKSRSKMNALKHGLDAQTPILPGEDEAAFRARLDAWRADYPPRDPREEELLEQAARLSWLLDRADRVQAADLAARLALAQDDEARHRAEAEAAAEADRIGRQLIDGPPVIPCPTRDLDARLAGKRFRAWLHPDDPAHPERLLRRLESTAAGCRWLLQRWAELRMALQGDAEAGWSPARRLVAVRLLGKQPVDAVDDPMVQRIYLCSFALGSYDPQVFADQADEMTEAQFERFLHRLESRRVSDAVPADRAAARAELRGLVEGVMACLEARAARHAEREAATAPGRLAFDDSPEGERLRRLQRRILGSFLRTVNLLMKVRLNPDAPGPEASGNVAASPVEPRDCEKLRNEATAPTRGEHPGASRDEEAQPAPSGSSPNHAHSPDAESTRTLDATPELAIDCEKIRNEATAADRSDRIDEPQRHRDTEKDPEDGRESSDRDRSVPCPCLGVSVVQNRDRLAPAGPDPTRVGPAFLPDAAPSGRSRAGMPDGHDDPAQCIQATTGTLADTRSGGCGGSHGTFPGHASSKESGRGDLGPRPVDPGHAEPGRSRGTPGCSWGIGAVCTYGLAPSVPDLIDFFDEFQGAGFTGSRPIPATRLANRRKDHRYLDPRSGRVFRSGNPEGV